MNAIVFDALGYFEDLKKAGVPEPQARVQADALRRAFREYDAENRKELATKGDIKDLCLEMREMELRLLKWIIGIGFAVAVPILTALAKGFHWFGM